MLPPYTVAADLSYPLVDPIWRPRTQTLIRALLAAGDVAARLPGAATASHARAIPRNRLFGKPPALEAAYA